MLFHVGAREDLFFEQVWLEFSAARKILCDETVGTSIIIRAWVRHRKRTLIVLLSDGRNLRLIVMIIAIMMVQIIVAIRQSIARL